MAYCLCTHFELKHSPLFSKIAKCLPLSSHLTHYVAVVGLALTSSHYTVTVRKSRVSSVFAFYSDCLAEDLIHNGNSVTVKIMITTNVMWVKPPGQSMLHNRHGRFALSSGTDVKCFTDLKTVLISS
jgi:hypothetical protein